MGAMIAGRELDALVAEKVMGEYVPCPSPYPGSPYQWFRGSNGAIISEVDIEPYSISIDAAWMVVEKMTNAHVISVGCMINRKWRCQITRANSYPQIPSDATADTAPMAICLAALKAVGVEVT